MIAALSAFAPIAGAAWALSSAYDWATRTEHDGRSPPLWSIILAIAVGIVLLVIGCATALRISGIARKGGVLSDWIFAAERVVIAAIKIVPNTLSAIVSAIGGLVGLA